MPALLDTPDIRQRLDFSCGVAAFRTVCAYWQVPTQRITADPHDGLHPFELEPALRRAGLWVQAGSMSLDDLRHHHKQGRPVACLIRTDDGGHWVVVRGLTRSRVHYQDPAGGRASVSFAGWESRWWDSDRAGTVFRRHGVVAWL